MKKVKFKELLKLKYLGALVVIIFMAAGVAWGINRFEEGFRVDYGKTIDIHAENFYGSGTYSCKKVVNDSFGFDYFVPTKTSDEWDAFTANLPQGVSLTDCCPAGYHDMDGDGYGAGDPCPDGTYAIVDNNSDCSDSDATSFPGNTGTNLLCNYSTPCAGFYRGSGLDHNCDGASTKALWQDANVAPYTSSNNLPTTLYYVSSSGAYIAVDAASGACGTVWNNTVGSWAGAGSWYIAGTGGYSVAFFGGAEVLCK